MNEKWLPRVLVIGPGAIKGLKILGFLSPIEDSGLLEYVDTYCGVSVGSIISLLIVAGYPIREIVKEAATFDIFRDMESISITNIITNRGLISTEGVRNKLINLVIAKLGVVPTLHGLYMQTGKSLVTVTLNATDEKCVIMNPFTHPQISCVDAVLFSMNIPFIFYQLIYQGKTYVDGALANPYPVDYFDDEKTKILGIYIKTLHDNPEIRLPDIPLPSRHNQVIQRINNEADSALSITTYILKTIQSLMDHRRNHIIQNSSTCCKHVCLETRNRDSLGYTLTDNDKINMLVEGYNEGKKFLENLKNNTYTAPNIPPKMSYEYPIYHLYLEAEENSLNSETSIIKEINEQ